MYLDAYFIACPKGQGAMTSTPLGSGGTRKGSGYTHVRSMLNIIQHPIAVIFHVLNDTIKYEQCPEHQININT